MKPKPKPKPKRQPKPKIDLVGQRFGKLTITQYVGRSEWMAKCDCGKVGVYFGGNLKRGATKSCGCARQQLIGDAHRSHGMSLTPEYRAYYRYREASGYENFDEWLKDVGRTPHPAARIDRKDRSIGFVKGNLCWNTGPVPTRRSRLYYGKLITELTDVPKTTVQSRLNRGWCIDCAIQSDIRSCPHIKAKAHESN